MGTKKIIQVLGPTGVGKSRIAIELARRFQGEIISADSVQVYRDFNIGADKLDIAARQGIPHYLIDILSDATQFNASLFLEHSFAAAEDIVQRGKIPIVCGGTALYLKTMQTGIFPENEEKKVSREQLNRIAARRGLQVLFKKLHQVDPGYAAKVGQNDRIRIIRALEIYYNNGAPPTEIFKQTHSPFYEYEFIRLGLDLERELLYQRIERRVDDMISRGLLEEVIDLKEKYPLSCPAFKSLGYKEMLLYLEHKITCFGEAALLIKQHSRNFAKRQLSWFRQEKDIHWFDPRELAPIIAFVQEKLGDRFSSSSSSEEKTGLNP